VKLANAGAAVFVPDGRPADEALARTTHMGVVAHPDDLELLAYRGILDCFGRSDRWFCGVVVTDGAGSPRTGPYADFSGPRMREVRREEQKKAGVVGEYGSVVLLDFTSARVKAPPRKAVVEDLAALLRAARPKAVYTHNLADRHATHVAVALAVVAACRRLPAGDRPERLLGGEVWRDLDWLAEADKVTEDVGGHESLAAALIGVFHSQIGGGKRYDLAVRGRRRAHATYHRSHEVDATTGLSFAMDMTPLLKDDKLEPAAYARQHLDRFAAEVRDQLARLGEGRW
jgi:LmbE family N-acetylglucosaminyl deacetylase